MPVESKSFVQSTIAGFGGNARPLCPPIAEHAMLKVRNPETGETLEVSRQNVGDYTRLRNWELCREPAETRSASQKAEAKEKEEAGSEADEEEVLTFKDIDPEKMNDLEKLRYAYFNESGNEPDLRWGKRRLEEELEKVEADKPKAPETIDEG
jgi:hypothetical protein